MPMEPGHTSDSGYHIRGTVVAITGIVGVFLPFSKKKSKCHRAIILYFRR